MQHGLGVLVGVAVIFLIVMVIVAAKQEKHYKALPPPATPEEAEKRRKNQRNDRIGLAVSAAVGAVAVPVMAYHAMGKGASGGRRSIAPSGPTSVPQPALNGAQLQALNNLQADQAAYQAAWQWQHPGQVYNGPYGPWV